MAEQIVEEGRADLVGIGRGLIADPHWANKAAEGRVDEIHQCIACTRCIDVLFTGNPLGCTVNPMVGREEELGLTPAEQKKKVMVIGGGAIGCETDHFLAEYGKSITIVEMLDEVGEGLGFIPRPLLLERLNKWDVKIITSAKVIEILEDGVLVERNGKKEKLTGYDSIVAAFGYVSVAELYEEVKNKIPETYVVGDAHNPSKVDGGLDRGHGDRSPDIALSRRYSA
ncbi:MAG: FAD-dependent oxidoreductase [Deltaproteobacteria bacterium]|nr:FAD-dependent oxidoreductase [Deltaproteobacteria bacterium]